MGNYFVVFRKISIFASWYSAFCWICGHTLYGCVDWNLPIFRKYIRYGRSHPVWVCGLKHYTLCRKMIHARHTLYGCVDWNYYIGLRFPLTSCHTLYGCVDWNTNNSTKMKKITVTPCMGVWIETRSPLPWCRAGSVTPCMGVWIETLAVPFVSWYHCPSHPVWVCGLKQRVYARW